MQRNPDRDDEPSPAESEALGRDLRKLFPTPAPIPPEIDAAILDAASRDLTRPSLPAGRSEPPWALRLLPLAAALLLVFGAAWWALWGDRAPDRPSLLADVDRSGRVDILDAYRLARALRDGDAPLDDAWDVNADGAVDQADVEQVATAAVRIGS